MRALVIVSTAVGIVSARINRFTQACPTIVSAQLTKHARKIGVKTAQFPLERIGALSQHSKFGRSLAEMMTVAENC